MIKRCIPLLILLLSVNAYAGGKVTIQSEHEGEKMNMVIEYLDANTLRMNMPGQGEASGYMLVKGRKVYTVTNINNSPMVMDMAAMGKMASAFGAPDNSTNQNNGPLGYKVLQIKATGKKETVAGFTGKVYLLTTQENGNTKTEEVVLSTAPQVRDYAAAWSHATIAMEKAMGQKAEEDTNLNNYMAKHKLGLLRYGKEFRVLSIENTTPPADRFNLPSPPMSMPDFGSMFGAPAN